ncbi:MAG: hypothetical protein ACRDBY_14205 [Cetobacterium sp.]
MLKIVYRAKIEEVNNIEVVSGKNLHSLLCGDIDYMDWINDILEEIHSTRADVEIVDRVLYLPLKTVCKICIAVGDAVGYHIYRQCTEEDIDLYLLSDDKEGLLKERFKALHQLHTIEQQAELIRYGHNLL